MLSQLRSKVKVTKQDGDAAQNKYYTHANYYEHLCNYMYMYFIICNYTFHLQRVLCFVRNDNAWQFSPEGNDTENSNSNCYISSPPQKSHKNGLF